MKRDGVAQSIKALRRSLAGFVAKEGFAEAGSIPEEMGFYEWCLELARRGLKVDGKPFDLESRPSLIPLYKAVPRTRAEAVRQVLVIQKGAQMGLTVWEMLADLYLAIKFEPLTIGMYLPDQLSAQYKSENRFMRFMRSVPDIYARLVSRIMDGQPVRIGEGNVMTRVMGESTFLFLWTSGKVSTESRPMDVLSFDEVQEMALEAIDKTMERISASDFRYTLMLSTANWPDSDINFWYKRGSQWAFHTRCLACEEMTDLSDHFPACIEYNAGAVRVPAGCDKEPALNEYVYICPKCKAWIPDTQRGEFVAGNPKEKRIQSFHVSQIISPTITARDLVDSWAGAVSGDQRKTFFNRKLGKPYVDPDQTPVTMEICLAAAAAGVAAGLKWETSGVDTVMGIDQMGSFNVVIIKKRMADGRQAVVHVEAIFNIDPFERCAELMNQYGVALCVVETLPNVNDARKFANRFKGRVYLAGYADLRDDMMNWSDDMTKSDRRTSDEDRTRYTVTLNQYKVMQAALFRIKNQHSLFPDPAALEQEVIDKGIRKRICLLRDWVFLHFTKTALVIEQDDETRKPRPKVKKIGIDPHFAYANMLCDVAWARKNGNTMMILPGLDNGALPGLKTDVAANMQANMPGLSSEVIKMVDSIPTGVCGGCRSFKNGFCNDRGFSTGKMAPACIMYDPISTETA
jgi:hypothetical protein